MTHTVVFDIGGVLVPEGTRMRRLEDFVEQRTGSLNREPFAQAYWAGRNRYDLGCLDERFWLPVFAAAGIDTSPGDRIRELVAATAAQDADANTTITAEPRALLDDLAAAGIRLAILSNAPRRMAQAARQRDWCQPMATAVFSSEVGVMKPADVIYSIVDADLKVNEEQRRRVHFFDDRQVNVDAAHAHGWSAHLWTGADDARRVLIEAGMPLENTTGR
ncbi:HAD family hydrolase [Corynebacterium uterequi]|uniref:Putative HAD superfamily hydrolase n=1 Tax=Corynebacterium uterequi TaxID=1072256 RepID=A0A0G3HE98_9CORY|nr:HAD family hydrolase [Corynebacterium uterequi]AKK11641.1 putative HAD superfamily hydrolase [Corynebacterium uterequi]